MAAAGEPTAEKAVTELLMVGGGRMAQVSCLTGSSRRWTLKRDLQAVLLHMRISITTMEGLVATAAAQSGSRRTLSTMPGQSAQTVKTGKSTTMTQPAEVQEEAYFFMPVL